MNTIKMSMTTLWAIIASTIVLALPIITDLITPRVISAFYVDVSQSNQEFKPLIQQLCQATIEHLKEGDIRIYSKFADKTLVLNNQIYQERDRLTRQKQCQDAATAPPGVGQELGTPLSSSLANASQEIQKQRTLGNRDRSVIIFAISSAEPKQNQAPLNPQELNSQIQTLVKDGSLVVFIGPSVDLQQQLKDALTNVKNTNICTYENGKQCIDWVFETARKKA